MESRPSQNQARKIRPEMQKVLDEMWKETEKDLKLAESIERSMSK
jgi:hypothetical protein